MSQGPNYQIVYASSADSSSAGTLLTFRAPFSGRIAYFGAVVEVASTVAASVLSFEQNTVAKAETLQVALTDAIGDVIARKPPAGGDGWLVNEGDLLTIESDGGSTAGTVTAWFAYDPAYLDPQASNVSIV